MKRISSLIFMVPGILSGLFLFIAGLSISPVSALALGLPDLEQYLAGITQPIGEITPSVAWQVLAKAKPDECFYGKGDPRNAYDPSLELPCPEPATAKVNQSYVWGITKSGDNLWFGTGANVLCLVMGNYFGTTSTSSRKRSKPAYICEMGASQFLAGALPAIIGDWRPPYLYSYNTKNGTLTDIGSGLPSQDLMRLQMTLGIRSAGTLGDVVFFGGPAMNLAGGINIFAFNVKDGSFLASATLSAYNNIRKWAVAKGVLYTTVGNVDNSAFGGTVLRWDGSVSNPMIFTEVGKLDGAGAEIIYHEGRVFVSTWPGREMAMSDIADAKIAGLWMSPPLPKGGLTAADADQWTKVWKASDYEPDEITALTYAGGGMASFDGYLYWGTMHVPLYAAYAQRQYYSSKANYPTDKTFRTTTTYGTWRAISIFRGKNFDSQPQIELLYGESTLPKYTYNDDTQSGDWTIVPNNMGGVAGLYGHSGFGNRYNNYTWSMAVYKDELYVGTMDWAFLARAQRTDKPWNYSLGADLYRFPDAKSPAVPENNEGVGNYLNYGVRNMVASDDELYLGIADPMNLMTDPNDDEPDGGWELIKVTGGKNGGGGGSCSTAGTGSGSPILLLVLPGMILFGLLILRRRKKIR
ncbi:MAG: hypothetical protein PHE84_00060 [bacterium]|nr:hypothetical protein [bacterium]